REAAAGARTNEQPVASSRLAVWIRLGRKRTNVVWREPRMIDRPSRRDFMRTTMRLSAVGASAVGHATLVRAEGMAGPEPRTLTEIDATLRAATRAGELPGVVALVANQNGILYEGMFGKRRLPDGPAVTRDTVFRVASMVKLITSVAALQLVEQGRIS